MLFLVTFERVVDRRSPLVVVERVVLSRKFDGSLLEVAEEASDELRALGYALIQTGKPADRTRVTFDPA